MKPGTDRTQYREVLASLVQQTQTRFPALNGRLTSATKLALLDDVDLHDDGTATVHSASDATRHYRIVEGTCTCRDWEQAPEHLCQHRLAAGLVRRTYALLPQSAGVETAVLALPPGPAQPLPEAPASVNVRLVVGGREVQWTLRDTDEARLALRLEALLAQYPTPQPPAVQADTTPQCPQHGAMKPSKKGTGWYCPRKLDDGSWCKGK